MQITVSGKNLDVGDALRARIEQRLRDGVSKYLDRVTSVTAVVMKESHFFRVDIVLNPGTHSGMVVRASGQAEDVYAAFDVTADKVEKQLRRYKRRITNHHQSHHDEALKNSVPARKYVIAPEEDEKAEEEAPLVIAEKVMAIESLTVSQAVMKLDLSDLPALMFFNRAHGGLNVIYRRVDGNISWVDPERVANAA